jgi:type II secretory pathway pseudopilin PulG
MISIAIIGIIMAVAAPSIGAMIQRKKVIAAANELVSVIGYSRSEAMAGQSEILVSFDDGAAAQGVSCVQVATMPLTRKSACHCWGNIADICRVAGAPGGKMLRIYSIPISGGVTFSTSDLAWPDATVPGRFSFVWPRLLTDLPETLKVTVSGSRGFQLRVDISSTGQASICAPAGAEAGYPACT